MFSIFKRNDVHLVGKKAFKRNKDNPFSKFSVWTCKKKNWFMSSFDNINFAINGKYSPKNYDNPKYYASLWFFKHTKMWF
jgi:hypothetical protein